MQNTLLPWGRRWEADWGLLGSICISKLKVYEFTDTSVRDFVLGGDLDSIHFCVLTFFLRALDLDLPDGNLLYR